MVDVEMERTKTLIDVSQNSVNKKIYVYIGMYPFYDVYPAIVG